MRKGRYFLNKTENVPEITKEDRDILWAILFGILLVICVFIFIL